MSSRMDSCSSNECAALHSGGSRVGGGRLSDGALLEMLEHLDDTKCSSFVYEELGPELAGKATPLPARDAAARDSANGAELPMAPLSQVRAPTPGSANLNSLSPLNPTQLSELLSAY